MSDLIQYDPETLKQAGQAANRAAANNVFEDYRSRRPKNTLRAQDSDLKLFGEFLAECGIPEWQWSGITWGLVQGFVKWMLQTEFSIASINRALSTIKVYARLAMQVGMLEPTEYQFIKAVAGYKQSDKKTIDDKREAAGLRTRVDGAKKGQTTHISDELAERLMKEHNLETPVGIRNALIMSVLLRHGLRCGEISGLLTDNWDSKNNQLTFYRPKVKKTQTHNLADWPSYLINLWVSHYAIPGSKLLRKFDNQGNLSTPGLSERSITELVATLGKAHGVEALSAHDCRHYWATRAARYTNDPFALQEAGGWNSLAMPRRYIKQREIANSGIKFE